MTTRHVAFVAWAGLVLLQLAWHVWLAPPTTTALGPTLALSLLPLLLPLLAMRQPGRALLWVAIACLFYFCHGIAEAWWQPSLRPLAILEIALSLTVILAVGLKKPRRRRAKLR